MIYSTEIKNSDMEISKTESCILHCKKKLTASGATDILLPNIDFGEKFITLETGALIKQRKLYTHDFRVKCSCSN